MVTLNGLLLVLITVSGHHSDGDRVLRGREPDGNRN
jgi:hypothetical protein